MKNSKSDIKQEIVDLYAEGSFLRNYIGLVENRYSQEEAEKLRNRKSFKDPKNKNIVLSSRYQKWYSKAVLVIKQLLPDRYNEFQKLYQSEKRDNKPLTNSTYTISDYLIGIKVQEKWGEQRVDEPSVCLGKFEQQLGILESCVEVIDSKLYSIESVLQSELFEDELETAKVILKKGSLRVSGALAGITLERHLKKVCQSHSLKLSKTNPTISDFNEELKRNEIIDIPTWRLIQRLGDIRNLSVHAKEREPTKDEVLDLILGCEKLIAELF